MGLSGAIAGSFFDAATGTVVQLNSISQDSSFDFIDDFEKDLDGNRRRVRQRFELKVVTYQSEGIEQLQKWSKDNTKVEFVLAGKQENILIYRPSTITVQQPYNFSPRGRTLTVITMDGEAETLPVWRGMNLLHGFVKVLGNDFGWADENSDGAADGFNVVGSNQSFVNGVQSFDSDASFQGVYFPPDGEDYNNGTDVTRAFAFPLSGINLILSVDAVAVPIQVRSKINIYDYDGNFMADELVTIGNTGRKSIAMITPQQAYGIHLRLLNPVFAGTGETIQVSAPALRTDGLSIYTE